MIDKIISEFYKTMLPSESFSDGAEKIAKLFIRSEETVEPGELLEQLLAKAPSPIALEYLIFSFLDTRESDYDIIQYGTRFKRLRKIFRKILSNSTEVSSEAYHAYNTITTVCKISTPEEISIASQVAGVWLQKLKSGNRLSEREYIQLSLLIRGEATALKMQSDFISSNADAYNMKKMIRLLPLVSSTDELSQRLIETAEKLAQNKPIGEPVLSLEYVLKPDQFQKWLKKLPKDNQTISSFLAVLLQQRTKMIPLSRLAAVTSIIRYLSAGKGDPQQWIRIALEKSTKNGFQIEVGEFIHKAKTVLQDQGIIFHESSIYGNFNSIAINHLIGPDRLSRLLDSKEEYSIQELVIMGMRNDTFMCRLLGNPKIYNMPRIVDYVAKNSRSLMVLSKIAQTRELHTGLINNSVPLSLIQNPTHLPMNILRQFINPRYISLNEMKFLIRTPYGLRPDIYNEIKNFIERIR
jgi:hypothetical protein